MKTFPIDLETKVSLLKSKSANKTKTISIRVPLTLANELDTLKRDADRHGLVFNVADVVERALRQVLRSARNELIDLPTVKQPQAIA